MPNLKPTVEWGRPSILLDLRHAGNEADAAPAGACRVTVERSPEYIGWLFSPKLNLDIDDVGGMPGWYLGLYVSPLYGDERLHAYFYSVAPAYATPSRPAYDAPAGYGGTDFLAALWKRFANIWVGGFVRYGYLAGAALADSPLVRTRSNVAGGIAVSWIFAESSQKVEVKD